jgi:thiol-disulfide isomerase/thioredoxin
MHDLVDSRRRHFLRTAGIAAAGVGATGLAVAGPGWKSAAKAAQAVLVAAGPSVPLQRLFDAQQWLNAKPLRWADIQGKIVLLNFWTYSCINSLRMLPYTRAWAEKYNHHGLVTIGVHTPEFTFEKDIENVRQATLALGVAYPVALDSDHAIWRAFKNEAWPALYFIDAAGHVRHRVLGEGGYSQSERLIQQLLFETGDAPPPGDIVAVSGAGPEAAADDKDLASPETYVGYAKASNFAPRGGINRDASTLYQGMSSLPLNYWSLAGWWTIGSEFATLNRPSGGASYRFHARDLHFILGRSSQSRPLPFRVKLDGASPGADHGYDVDAEGFGSIQQDRMYQLVRQSRPVEDRTLEIEFMVPGVRAYDFTFG